MSFLQPILLAALPLMALPILIHLINQRRFQTIRWAAMMFLLAANRMSRGYAKLRQWLIMFFRMLAIAGLIFAISRPLASGWLGITAGGRADTTIILLDRSPSMRQQSPGTVASKLETGRQQLVNTLNMLGSSRWVLIESTTNVAHDLESPDALLKLPSCEPASASADLPAMLQAARDYVQANKSGRTEIWICSDIRQNDWNAESGRWQTLRDSFLEFAQGVRFHLLAYPQIASGNTSVRVTEVRRVQTADSAELLVSLKLTREGDTVGRISNPSGTSASNPSSKDGLENRPTEVGKQTIPIHFEIEGARSEVVVEMTAAQFELKDHRIPIERSRERGWGKVSIQADANPADNEFYFVFDQPTLRQTVVVADDPQAARPLQLSAEISPDPNNRGTAEVIGVEQLGTVEWDKTSLLLWQAPLPDADSTKTVQAFVDRGGQVIFFPPKSPGSDEFAGVKWQTWTESPEGIPVETWRGDQDLLAHTQSGAALPVGQLEIRKFCGITGEQTPLASLKGGAPLLARLTSNRGGVYFCATTPALGDSSLATNGVVLYVMVQRALASGAAVLGNTRQLVAGDPSGFAGENPATWQKLAGSNDSLSTDFAFHAGVYNAGDKLFAVNRSLAEDHATVLPDGRVTELFKGLDFARVDDQAGNIAALIQEIWRLFLACMMVALIVEAALCLPKIAPTATTPAGVSA
ncbi:MAG: BatA domain-containing protein [Planctomycetia bacterium]|nr:BatA domain-containing protein [Planctomycetia bacterium]